MKTREKGQILVILAVAMVAILAVTALAVDGSMMYNARRTAQTTADSSALAAASEAANATTCNATTRSTAITKAQSFAAAQEGVTLANDSSSPSRVEATCAADNKSMTIKVTVTSNTPTTFAKMVSRNQLTTKVEAITKVTFGAGTFAGGNGIVTTDTANCNANGGIYAGQGGDCYIETVGGGIISNNCITVEGSSYVVAYGAQTQYVKNLSLGWSARALNDTNVGATPTNTVINWNLPDQNGVTKQNVQPVAVRASQTLTPYPELTGPTMTAQTCEGLTDRGTLNQGWADHVVTVPSGKYDSITVNIDAIFPEGGVYCIKPGGSVELKAYPMIANKTIWYFMGSGSFIKSGNYGLSMDNSSVYIQNGDFTVKGGANITAHNITIYIKKGNFNLLGNVPAIMTAPDCDTSACGVGPGIKGVLLLMDKENTLQGSSSNPTSGQIWIQGSSSLTMEGTIFAPGSKVLASGNTALVQTLQAQIIAKRIEVTGSSKLRLDVTDANLYSGGGSTTVEIIK